MITARNPQIPQIALVTGATGLLGSHLAERLIARGDRVRALVRPTSDTRFLQAIGVDTIVGDLRDRESCDRAVEGIGVVYHSAAKVGDWGTWAEFRADVVEATERLARASIDAGVGRFVQISSTSAYGHPPEGGPSIDETAPLGVGLWPIWDGYTWGKVEAERVLWGLVRSQGLPLTVIRPSWLYGERDRTTTARLVSRMRGGGIPTIGPGNNPFSAIYAGEVAAAALLAADDPGSIGEAYNITDLGPITQQAFLDQLAEACGVAGTRKSLNYDLTFAVALGLEAIGRLTRSRRPPIITRYATWLMGRRLSYSTAKARERLGWRPSLTYQASLERTVRWFDSTTTSP